MEHCFPKVPVNETHAAISKKSPIFYTSASQEKKRKKSRITA